MTQSPLPVPARRRGHRRIPLVLGILILAVLFVAALQIAANLSYDAAGQRLREVVTSEAAAATRTSATLAEFRTAAASAEAMITSQGEALPIDPAAEAELRAALDDADVLVANTERHLDADAASAPERTVPFWELFAAAQAMDATSRTVSTREKTLEQDAAGISSASDAMTTAAVTVLTILSDSAPAFEGAHVSATNDAVIALRAAAAATDGLDTVAAAAKAYTALESAAAEVIASEQQELAEKAGPLLQNRLATEAFARSIAPGVLLDFDWSTTVSGAGQHGSMGGLTTWWWDPPGHATIALSDSVAQQWPSSASHALVAHEVGHAISVKCPTAYDTTDQDVIEQWATAWAISMGYTDDANGVWAYGYPSEEMIAAASGCR